MYYFVVNPNSRSGNGRKIWNQLRKELKQRRISYQYQLTEYVGHAVKLARQFSQLGTPEKPIYLVAVGGDGTITEVLTGITDFRNIIFGFIPTGSGNDFCRSMGLPQDPVAALNCVLSRKHIASMDVPCMKAGKRSYRFGISAGMGFDAAVTQEVAAAPSKKLLNRIGLGKLAYLVIALKQILFMNPTPMTLYLDGNRKYVFSKVYFTALMNLKYEGGGFQFCPNAQYHDGVLDILVVEGFSKLKILFCLPTAFFGKHTVFRGVHVYRCKNARVASAVPLPIHHDGESGGIQSEFSVSFEKNTLKIILPVL